MGCSVRVVISPPSGEACTLSGSWFLFDTRGFGTYLRSWGVNGLQGLLKSLGSDCPFTCIDDVMFEQLIVRILDIFQRAYIVCENIRYMRNDAGKINFFLSEKWEKKKLSKHTFGTHFLFFLFFNYVF